MMFSADQAMEFMEKNFGWVVIGIVGVAVTGGVTAIVLVSMAINNCT